MHTLTSLMSSTDKELGKLGRAEIYKADGACHLLGKIIFALASIAPKGAVMAKFVLATIGAERKDVPRQSWSIAVCAAYVCEEQKPGFVTEAVFDKSPARWLAVASAIHNLLDKQIATEGSGMDESKAAGYREQVAVILRERKSNGQTLLEALRDSLKPEANTGGGDGEGNQGEEVVPLEVQAMEALIEAANLIGQATFDTVQIASLQSTFDKVGQVIELKRQAASPAPIAPVTVETSGGIPSIVPAPEPAPAGTMPVAAAMEAAAVAGRGKRGKGKALAAAA